MLRWLLPLIAAMTLLGSAVTSWAAAGFAGEASCCCPDASKCKCHDHDGKPHPGPTLKRCSGDATFVAPEVVPALEPLVAPTAADVEVAVVATVTFESTPESVTIEPETPPF